MKMNETGLITDVASGALAQYLRVGTPGALVAAGANEVELGQLEYATFASGDVVAVRTSEAPGTKRYIASGAITQYAKVYRAAGGKVSGTLNGMSLGIALNATTADGDHVEVLPQPTDGSALLYNAVAASTAITNTTTHTAFSTNYTIPANTLKVGDKIRIRFQGIATATNSTDTLLIKLYIGGITGTALLTGTATDVANNNIFAGECELTIRTIGASGTFVAVGTHTEVPAASGTAVHDITEITAETTIDTTAAQQIAVSATWSVANAGNSCRLDIMSVQRVAA